MIAIPNMEKPKACYYCPLEQLSECRLLDNKFVEEIDPNDCPLIDIVKCGECKHYEPYMEQFTYSKPRGDGLCRRHESNTYDDDFCSYGERRADEIDDRLLDDM